MPPVEITRRGESARFFPWNWRLQHPLDGGENRPKSRVILAFHILDFSPQLLLRGQYASQLHKRAHDGDVDLHGAVTTRDAREHGHAPFSERLRAPPQLEITLCDFKSQLRRLRSTSDAHRHDDVAVAVVVIR